MKLISSLLGALVLSAVVLSAQTNLTGKWVLDVQTGGATGTPTITLKQDGEKLTGHYSGQLGEAELAGSVKGSDFKFSFSNEIQGNKFEVIYTGTVDKDTMQGTVDLAGMATGTFTGKKQ